MQIYYEPRLNTHIAVDNSGVILGKYNPKEHGSLDDFKQLITKENAK